MKLVNLGAVLFSLVFSLALLGQWPVLSTGAIDLNGPAPMTPDGKPDFSGLWSSGGPGGGKGKDKAKDKAKDKGKDNAKDKGPPPDGFKGKAKGPPVGG